MLDANKLRNHLDSNLKINKPDEKEKYSGEMKRSNNDIPVEILDSRLKRLIRIIKPSRSSLTYEKYE